MAIFSVVLVIALHGASSLKVFAIVGGNYILAKKLGGSRIAPLVLWTLNIAVLLCNEIYDGYSFSSVHSSLGYLVRKNQLHEAKLTLEIGRLSRVLSAVAHLL